MIILVLIFLFVFLIFQPIEKYKDTCYTYAMKDLDPHRMSKKIPGNKSQYNRTCDELISNIKEDYPHRDVHILNRGMCPQGYYQVAPFIDPDYPTYEFHFYRKDPDGWTHKLGLNEPNNIDASDNIITDPDMADRNYGDINYTRGCSDICVSSSL